MPDESLLLQVRRAGWFSVAHVIADADGKCIGVVDRQVIQVALRVFRATGGHSSGAITEGRGGVVAKWQPERTGTRLEFGDLLRHEPFVKMAILGALLSMH